MIKKEINDNYGTGLRLEGEEISKRFGYRSIFRDISITLSGGESLGIAGPNGSGKSTLLKIFAGILRPSTGSVARFRNNDELFPEDFIQNAGYLSPELHPYEELSPLENYAFVRRGSSHGPDFEEMLNRLGLYKFRNSPVKNFSSGMRQRLSFILTVINSPSFVFFDEPGMNLDRQGRDVIYSFIESLKNNRIIIIAANEPDELALCDRRLDLE